MKIVAIMGTYRKNGAGAGYVKLLEQALGARGDVEFRYVWLGEYNIGLCRGCMVCYECGEAACPLKDGYLQAMEQLNGADAAIIYSPTYTVSITGIMKGFFDRSSYVLHRPYFKGRHALVLTVSDTWGERSALKTLRQIVSLMGFSIDGMLGIANARYEKDPAYHARVEHSVAGMAARLHACVRAGQPVRPSLFELIAFRAQKSFFGADTGGCRNDKQFWRQAGWTAPDAAFYCPARISALESFFANLAVWYARKVKLWS